MEAVNNAARHAAATTCQIMLKADQDLVVEITDDGTGLPSRLREGVGLTSMRERAAGVGGVCAITSRQGHGTVVQAHLPLSVTTAAEDGEVRPGVIDRTTAP
jgi:signal transduction histidine kinase